MKKFWNFDLDYTEKHKSYHFSTISHEDYTSSQIYFDVEKDTIAEGLFTEKIDVEISKKLSNSFLDVLLNRKSFSDNMCSGADFNKREIHEFIQYSFLGSEVHRAYPSGGALYDVHINILFNPAIAYNKSNIACLDLEKKSLNFYEKKDWSQVVDAFIQKDLIGDSKIVIVLSCNLNRIVRKYKDIAYKLIMLEAGHVAQNVQLYCAYKKWNSLPIKGFYDIKLNKLLQEDQSSLYAIFIG